MKILTLAIFVVSYFFFIYRKDSRAQICWAAVLLLVLSRIINIGDVISFINWNVLAIFVGAMIVAQVFNYSKVPAYLADILVSKSKNVSWAILSVCIISGVISMFGENVATVLIVAPIAFAIAKKLEVSPIPFLVGIAVASNLQGTGTLVGDPLSMLIAGFIPINFNEFFWFKGRLGIFFAVQAGFAASFAVLYFLFRKYKKKVSYKASVKVKTWIPTIILLLMVLALALSSMVSGISDAGLICLAFAVLSLAIYRRDVKQVFREFDWETLFFLAGIFVMVGSLTKVGIIDSLAVVFGNIVGNNKLFAYLLIVWFSVLFSAFIDSIPFSLAMLPVAQSVSQGLGIEPYLLYFGLVIGASVGGNVTPIGASANIVACGLLKKEEHPVGFIEFVKIGLPYTVVAVLASSAVIWFIWGN